MTKNLILAISFSFKLNSNLKQTAKLNVLTQIKNYLYTSNNFKTKSV